MCVRVVYLSGLLICLSQAAAAAPFEFIRIGDFDGFGFSSSFLANQKAANGGPADTNGNGVLDQNEFLPDQNRDRTLNTDSNSNGVDNFDNRTAAERAGSRVTGIGFTDRGSSGSERTDISLSQSFTDIPNFPPGDRTKNTFKFEFFVEDDSIVANTPVFFNLIHGDFGESSANSGSIVISGRNGNSRSAPLLRQDQLPGGKAQNDGLIQSSSAELSFDEVFAPVADGYEGEVEVQFNFSDAFVAVDFVELSVEEIAFDPPDAALGQIGPLDFGDVLVRDTVTGNLAIENSGEAGSTLTGDATVAPPLGFPAGGATAFNIDEGESGGIDLTFSPTETGQEPGDVTITSNGGGDTVTVNGNGVAPVGTVSAPDVPVLLRAGTAGSVAVQVENTGGGNSAAVNGSLTASGLETNLLVNADPSSLPQGFTIAQGSLSLGDGDTGSLIYDIDTSDRGSLSGGIGLDFENGNPDGSNTEFFETATIDADIVGPVFGSSIAPGSTIELGEIRAGEPLDFNLTVGNDSDDDNDGAGFAQELVGLSLLSFDITGADFLSIDDTALNTVLMPNEDLLLDLLLDPGMAQAGAFQATLVIGTDQNTAFGSMSGGDSFSFTLTGTVLTVPVPSAALLLLPGAIATLCRQALRARPR